MTTPSGTIKLTDVQTEFGGASPVALSEYYRAGSYVPSTLTGVPASGTISMSQLRGLTKVVGAIVNPLNGTGTLPQIVSGRASTSDLAWIRVFPDGTIDGMTYGNVQNWVRYWYSPTVAGIGSSYWIRASLVSGSVPNGGSDSTFNTWIPISGVCSWAMQVSGGVSGFRAGTIRLDISANSNGSPVLTTGTVYIEASYG